MDIVLVDEAPIFDDALHWALNKNGHLSDERFTIRSCRSAREIPSMVNGSGEPQLFLVDLHLGLGEPSGLEALRHLADHPAAVPVLFATDLDGDRAMFALAAAEVTGGLAAIDKGQEGYGEQVAWAAERIYEGFTPNPTASVRAGLRWLYPLRIEDCTIGARSKTLLELLFRAPWRLEFYLAALGGATLGAALRAAHVNPDASPAPEIAEVLDAVEQTGRSWTRLGPVLNAARPASAGGAEPQDDVPGPLPWPRLNQFLALHRAFFTDPALPALIAWHQTRTN